MILRRHYAVDGITKTKAAFFEDVEVGDRLRASVVLRSSSNYSPQVTVENLTQGTKRVMTMGLAYNGLHALQLRELD